MTLWPRPGSKPHIGWHQLFSFWNIWWVLPIRSKCLEVTRSTPTRPPVHVPNTGFGPHGCPGAQVGTWHVVARLTFLIPYDVYERSKEELSHFTDEESGRFLGKSKVACSRWCSKWTNWTLNSDLCPGPPAFPWHCAALPSPFLVACGRCSLFLHCPHLLCLPGGLLYIHQGPGSVPLRSDALLAFVILTTLCAGSVCLFLQLHGKALERGTGLWWWPPWW